MICSKCQLENPEGKKFCCGCGSQLALVCSGCGSELIPGDRFCSNCGQKLEEAAETGLQTPYPSMELGRKQATVLFSDLSGYTVISEKLDPEDVRDLMSQVFGEVARVVARYEGFIDRFIGDAVLVIFGIPQAHEDDAIRAVKAAKEIHDLVSRISRRVEARIGLPLIMHTGIDTGMVVADDSGVHGGGYSVTGDTINLASRLSDLAEAGEILVSPDTYRLVEGYFEFNDLGPTDIKGKEKPVGVYRLLSVRERPVTIHNLSGLKADLVGRDVEMGRLWEALGGLREGRSTVFCIYGDAGTGKSRLINEFKATLDLEEIQWIEGHAYDYCQNIPYFPIIDGMNRVWQIGEGDASENVREKVEAGIERAIPQSKDIIPYIGGLYSLSYPEMEGIDPEFWRNCLYKAMLEVLSALVQRGPTIFFMEDLHWADPSSLDLIRYVSTELKYPALFLFVYRPYFDLFTSHQLTALGDSYQEIETRDLSSSEAHEMMISLLKTRNIPHQLGHFIQEKAEGNPFYLEEVVNSLIESEILTRSNGNWKIIKSLDQYNLSRTIQGIVSGRIDYLEVDVKRTLQEASVIGRAFLHTVLKEITESPEQVDRCLNELERLDLIRIRSTQPDVEYIFKHALTREIVYNSLLKRDREEIHGRIGNAIEKIYPNRLSEFYETLAFHFKQSTSTSKAVDYLIKSGEKSFGRDAIEEAHQYFKEAFNLLADKSNRSKEEEAFLVDILTNWTSIAHARGDWTEITGLLIDYKNTVESLGDKARLGMFHAWLGFVLYCQQRLQDAHQYLQYALELGEEVQNQRVITYTHDFLAWVCADLGLIEEGILHGKKAVELISQIPLTKMDVFIFSQAVGGLGWAYWHKGDRGKVMETAEILLKFGQKDYHGQDLAMGQWMKAFGYMLDGDLLSSMGCMQKATEISKHPSFLGMVSTLLSIVYVHNGQFREAEQTTRGIIAYSDNFGGEVIGAIAKVYLGVALIAQGNMQQGMKIVKEAQRTYLENDRKGMYVLSEYALGKVYLQFVEKSPSRGLSTIFRNIGFIAKNVPSADNKAEYHFNKAIQVASDTGARGFLGMAYLDLGLLHKTKGRTDKARECLSEAIQLFEQCEIDTYMRQAREALASLR